MLLTAAIAMLLIAVFTQNDVWDGFAILIYFIGIGVAVLGWGLQAVASVLPVVSGWSDVLLSVVTGPLGLPVWQSVVIATVLFFGAVATADTDTGKSGESTDDGSSSPEDRIPNVEELPGVGEQKAVALRDAGYETAADILAASKSELTDVDGVGTALAAKLTTTIHDRYEDRGWYDSVDQPTVTETATDDPTATETTADNPTATETTADESPVDASTNKPVSDGEKRRLVAGLEATCDRIEELVAAGAVADANDRVPATRAAVGETRDALTTLSGDRDLRVRVNDVEDWLDAIPSEAEAQFDDVVADGDAHVTEAQDAVETGDVDAGLEACENAHAAYRSARQLGETANEQWFSEREAALDSRISTVESLADRFAHEKAVQQAEATIDALTQRVTTLKETANPQEAEAVMESVVEDGTNALSRLPDDITAPELSRRVTHLREQVTEFKTVAEHLAAQSASTPPDTPAGSDAEPTTASAGNPSDTTNTTQAGTGDEAREPGGSGHSTDGTRASDEPGGVVRAADGIEETARHPAPVVLRVRDQLTEDGRRRVFRAETVDGDAVQLDVWNRHVGAFECEPDTWYTFENVRGQRWTVNGESGVTVSTTPDATVTQHDPSSGADVTTG